VEPEKMYAGDELYLTRGDGEFFFGEFEIPAEKRNLYLSINADDDVTAYCTSCKMENLKC
jgi:hypothetical protein